MTSPFSLPEDLVDSAREDRSSQWLSTITKDLDRKVSEGMRGLEQAATSAIEPIKPFAQALQDGGLKVPTLDDLTPSWMVKEHAEKAQGLATNLQAGGVSVPSVADLTPGGGASATASGRPEAMPSATGATRGSAAPVAPEPLGPIEEGNPERYFATAGPYARQVERETGVPAALSLAISANETGYGQRRYMAGANNYHGIQDTTGTGTPYRDWRPGPNGEKVYYEARQSGFETPLEGFRGFARFLTGNPRYQPALERYRQTGDVNQLAADIHRAGYAEDPSYTTKITSIMRGIPVSTGVGEVTAPAGTRPSSGRSAAMPEQASRAPGATFDPQAIEQAYKGKPYVFGGAGGRSDMTPGVATDCSGFVASVWRNTFGVSLPAHTDASYNQLRQLGAPEVSRQDARPGDVVYYMGAGTGGAITHHMGIYAGGGKVLDMSTSGGSGVRERDIGHAGRFVILRDPRVNPEQPKTATAPPPIIPSADSGGVRVSRSEADALAQAAPNAPTPAGQPPSPSSGTSAGGAPPPPADASPLDDARAGPGGAGAGLVMKAPLGQPADTMPEGGDGRDGMKPRPIRNIEPLGPALRGATTDRINDDAPGIGTNRNIPVPGDPISEGPEPPPTTRNQAVQGDPIEEYPPSGDGETMLYRQPLSQQPELPATEQPYDPDQGPRETGYTVNGVSPGGSGTPDAADATPPRVAQPAPVSDIPGPDLGPGGFPIVDQPASNGPWLSETKAPAVSPYGEPVEPTKRSAPDASPTAPSSTMLPVWDENERVVGYRQAPPPAQRQVTQRQSDGYGAVSSTPGEPDYVPSPPSLRDAGPDATQAAIDAAVESYSDPAWRNMPADARTVRIIQEAAAAYGDSAARSVAKVFGVTDDALFSILGHPVSGQDVAGLVGSTLADPTNYVPGVGEIKPMIGMARSAVKDAASAFRPSVRAGTRVAGEAIGDAGRAISEGVQGAGRRINEGLAANAERTAAADARMASEGAATAYGAVGMVPEVAPHVYSPTPPPGTQRRYHGTAGAFDAADPAKFDESGLYGPGYYTTSDPRVASSYAEQRGAVVMNGNVGFGREGLERAIKAAEDMLESLPPASRQRPALERGLAENRAMLEELNSRAPNVRPIDIPPDVKLLDIDRPLTPDLIDRVERVIARATPEIKPELEDAIAAARNRLQVAGGFYEPAAHTFVNELFDAAERIPGMGKGLATEILSRAGFDGIAHTGGQRVPMLDGAGNPIEHDVSVIFPGSVNKVRNAFSGTYGGAGAGVLPPGGPAVTDRLGAVNNVLSQGVASAVSGGVGAQVNQQMNPDDPYAGVKGFAAGALVPQLATRGVRAGLRAAGRMAEGADGALATFGAAPGRRTRQPGQTFAVGSKPGERFEFRVKVVPLSDLVTSHTDALAINRVFPSELQPRVRERAASRLQIDRIVNEFDPEQMLVDFHTVDRGPMIVGPDNVVESGNGRSIALRRLAKEKPEEYARYVEDLKATLQDYGLSEDAVKGIDQPVLVRERLTDVDRARFAADANVGVQAGMSPIERATQTAGRLSDDTVSRIAIKGDESIDAALLSSENEGLRRAFLATVPETEWNDLLQADGNLNPDGLNRLKSALLVKTYQGDAGLRLATAFVESTDPGIANVERGIYASLPAMARAEARIASGEADAGLSIASDVAQAADVYARLRRARMSVPDYVAQAPMFGGRETTPLQDRILAYFAENSRAPSRIRAILDEYASAVEQFAPAGADDMFGGAVATASKDEVLDGVLRRLGRGVGAADEGAELGRAGAGGQVVAGPAPGSPGIPEPRPSAAEGTGSQAGLDLPPAPAEPALRPVARPGAVAEDFAPTGGPEGRLDIEGAPTRLANPTAAERGTLPAGGPDGELRAPDLISPDVDAFVRRRFTKTPEKAEEVLAHYAAMKEAGADELALTKFLNTASGSWANRIGILRFAGMLSSTYTQVTNAMGSGLQVAGDVLGTVPAVGADVVRAGVTRSDREVYLAELPARVAAMRAASGAAAADAAFTLKHGIRPEDISKLDHLRGGFATNIPGLAPAGSRRAAAVDFAAEYPLRLMAASDVYFRSLAQAGHLAAEATARAAREGKGRVDPARVAELMTDPGLMARADELARKTVLQEDRGVTTWVRATIDKAPAPARMLAEALVPFVRTPYNVVAQGVEMSPLGAAKALYDASRGKMANRELSDRLSKAAVGTTIGAVGFALAAEGHVTGGYPEDERARSTLPPGWRPFSAVVDLPNGETRYIPLAALGPVAIPASLGAILGAARQNGQDVDYASVAESVGRFAEDQTFLRSLFDGVEAFRRGGNAIENYAESVAASYSPHLIGGGALGRQIQQAMGMAPRDPEGAVEALLATFPYTAGRVPPRLDVLGRETTTAPSGVEAFVPNVRTSIERDEPIIAAFRDAGQGLPRKAPDEVRDPATGQTVELDRDQQLAWREAFGQALEQRWQQAGFPRDEKGLGRIEQAARSDARRRVLGR